MSRCVFDARPGFCSALIDKICNGCKFCKTEKEYKEGIERANAILEKKNLIPVETVNEHGENIISVQDGSR